MHHIEAWKIAPYLQLGCSLPRLLEREITSQLLQRGCPADKPFAVVAQGTSNDQQVVLGTISDIAERLKAMPLPSPALLMMGDVIKANGYAQQLADQTLASYPAIRANQV